MPAPTKIYVACSGISGKGGGAFTKMGGYKKSAQSLEEECSC